MSKKLVGLLLAAGLLSALAACGPSAETPTDETAPVSPEAPVESPVESPSPEASPSS